MKKQALYCRRKKLGLTNLNNVNYTPAGYREQIITNNKITVFQTDARHDKRQYFVLQERPKGLSKLILSPNLF